MDLLQDLSDARRMLRTLLKFSNDSWETLDINYDPPRVERAWMSPEGCDMRICLHRIHPCEKTLYHPHPWPSAIQIVTGRYEMGIGHLPYGKDVKDEPVEIAKLYLSTGDVYVMSDPSGWHYVRPLGEPSLSLMIMKKPYDPQIYDHSRFGQKVEHGPLSDADRDVLLDEFRFELDPVFGHLA